MKYILSLFFLVSVVCSSHKRYYEECVDEEYACVTDFPECEEEDNYHGNKTRTVTGTPCQFWTQDIPHKSYDKDVGDHYYCRNPDGDIDGPWCYTLNSAQEWAYCFKSCDASLHCLEKARMSDDYTGTKSTTINDIPCQVWSSDSPHKSQFKQLGDHNYCRNPKGRVGPDLGPWCYTTDPEMEWDFCFTQCMQIFVQTSVNKKVAVDVETFDTLKNLKHKIHEIEGTAPHLQYLHFNNELLADDDKVLVDYGLGHKSTVHLTRN